MHNGEPQQVLITGAGGFVGPYLRDHCQANGDDVIEATLSSGPDLLDARGWADYVAKHSPSVIYHLAGWSDVGGSWDQPLQTFRVNAEGTLNVLEAARRGGVGRTVVVSSADVYGVVDPDDLPITEASAVQPSSPYGASKEAVEAIARQINRARGHEVVIARPFNHIGPGQSPKFATSAFADRVARCESEGGGEVTHGDLSPSRDFTDVRDVVRAYRLLASHGQPGQTYNICSGVSVSMGEILNTLIDLVDVEITCSTDPSLVRPVDLPILLGDATRLTTDTGWSPEIALADSLQHVLDDARARRDSH